MSDLFWTAAALGLAGILLLGGSLVFLGLRLARQAGARDGMETRDDESLEPEDLPLATLPDPQGGPETGGLSATLELDELLSQILETASALPGIDAAAITVESEGFPSVVAARGLSPEEAARQSLQWPTDHPRTVVMEYGAHDTESAPDGGAIRGRLVLPLARDDEVPVGSLTVLWRDPNGKPSDQEVSALEKLATAAVPALGIACRLEALRQLAYTDPLTGMHNYRFFHETLGREATRSHRYDRDLSLILLDLDDFKTINDQFGHLKGDAVLAEVAGRTRSVVRGTDIPCRVGGDEFAIILPESTVADAQELYRRLRSALDASPFGPAGYVQISAGIVGLRSEEDGTVLLDRADKALYRAKQAGRGQAFAEQNT
jgi:diguanylate cyclase (GGDEF)-like protein